MLKKLGFVDLHRAIKEKVESRTGIACLDSVPLNQPSPFYFVEITGTEPGNTKTMWCDVYNVNIHAIAEPGQSSVRIYELIQMLQEALTEQISLPDDFKLIYQAEQGLVSLTTDETNERHAVLSYDFKVCYGFRMKV